MLTVFLEGKSAGRITHSLATSVRRAAHPHMSIAIGEKGTHSLVVLIQLEFRQIQYPAVNATNAMGKATAAYRSIRWKSLV